MTTVLKHPREFEGYKSLLTEDCVNFICDRIWYSTADFINPVYEQVAEALPKLEHILISQTTFMMNERTYVRAISCGLVVQEPISRSPLHKMAKLLHENLGKSLVDTVIHVHLNGSASLKPRLLTHYYNRRVVERQEGLRVIKTSSLLRED